MTRSLMKGKAAGLALMASLALTACVPDASNTTASPPSPAYSQQALAFQQLCGQLPRGGIGAVREAALKQGYTHKGEVRTSAYGFSNFQTYENGSGIQLQISRSGGSSLPEPGPKRTGFCGIVSNSSGGSEANFTAAVNAFAAAQGTTPVKSRVFLGDGVGKLEYTTGNTIVRFGWQDRPYGLFAYTLQK